MPSVVVQHVGGEEGVGALLTNKGERLVVRVREVSLHKSSVYLLTNFS
jgi:molybdenum-dependent DNA-binding transcriptional regulator ModE